MTILINLFAFLVTAVGPLAAQVLASLGMGIVSFVAISATLGTLLTMGQSYYTGLPQYAFALISIAGFGQGLGIVAAAMTFKAAYLALPRLGVIPK